MLTTSQAMTMMRSPVASTYPQIRNLQKQLIREGKSTGAMAVSARRSLAMLFSCDVAALFFTAVEPVTLDAPLDSETSEVDTVQAIVERVRPYFNNIAMAIEEAKAFLPQPTSELLEELNAPGHPVYRASIAALLVMAANLQVPT